MKLRLKKKSETAGFINRLGYPVANNFRALSHKPGF